MTEERLIAWGDELRRVHARLRSALRLARDAIEDGAEAEPLSSDLLLYCRGFCVALRGHHRGEDTALFPRLVAAHPELSDIVDALIRDHSMLDQLIGDLERTMLSGASREETERHLDGIEAIMETHFGYEERKLVSVLDEMVDPAHERQQLFGPIA